MLPPRRLLPLRAVLNSLPIWDNAPALGTLIVGAPGTGKTILESLILLCHLIRGLPGCVLDPLGTLSDAFLFRLLWFLSEYPPGDDEFFWRRLRYIPIGSPQVAVQFPVYAQRDGETLWETASRLITVLERASPQLVSGSPLTWPAAKRLGINAGLILTALSVGLDQLEDLLFHASEWSKSGRFDEAISRNPQATQAVSYFREYYLALPRSEQRRIAGTLLDQVFFLTTDPTLRRVFARGGSTPGIDWEEVEALGQIVIINFKAIRNPTARSFAMQWTLEDCNGHLQARGRRETPFVLTIDEFANLTAHGTAENKPLADLFDELLAQYARNNRIFVTLAFQSLDQLPKRLQQTVLRLATIITGRAGSMREARQIADHLFRKDIYRIHHHKKVWGKVDPPPFIRGVGYRLLESLSLDKQRSPYFPYYILEYQPQYMGLDLQAEEAGGMIQKLQPLEFLCRPAVGDGAVSQDVVSLALSDAITDPDTGEGIFPDPEQFAALISQIQQQLAARSGIPSAEILREQEERLTDGISQPPPKPQPAGELDGRQPSDLSENGSRPDPAQPKPRNTKETPSRPTLTDNERVMLAFLCEHPDVPVSGVYKGLGMSVRKGTEIRDTLKEQGFLVELELRTGRTSAGRPMKFVVPTSQAFGLLGKEPPAGRGGVIHRYIQHLVEDGATTKGYSAQCEKDLGNGGIVDVYLEKGGERIGVEIAVLSKPSREVAHIRQCLKAGCDKIFGIFLDEALLARTAEAMGEVLSREEAGKVRLLPFSQLSQVAEGSGGSSLANNLFRTVSQSND